MGMDMGMGGAFGGAMHDAAMGGGAMGEMANNAMMGSALQDGAASYAGPLPESELAKKKKKQEAESSDMGNVGGIGDGFALSKNKAFGFGYEGEAKNTFTADGLAAVNQHYAQAQAAKEMQ